MTIGEALRARLPGGRRRSRTLSLLDRDRVLLEQRTWWVQGHDWACDECESQGWGWGEGKGQQRARRQGVRSRAHTRARASRKGAPRDLDAYSGSSNNSSLAPVIW